MRVVVDDVDDDQVDGLSRVRFFVSVFFFFLLKGRLSV